MNLHRLVPFLILLTLSLLSCSRHNPLTDAIPADATMVAAIDLDELASQLGTSLDGDSIAALAKITGFEKHKLDGIVKALSAVDRSGIMFVNLPGLDCRVMLARITDARRLDDALSLMLFSRQQLPGKRALFLRDNKSAPALILDNDIVWYVSNARKAHSLLARLDAMEPDSSFSTLPAVTGLLSSTSSPVTVAIPVTIDSRHAARILAGHLVIGNETMDISFSLFDNDENPVTLDGLTDIDSTLAADIPADMPLLAAAAFTPAFPWHEMQSALISATQPRNHIYVESLIAYLREVRGTALVAIAPDSYSDIDDADNFLADWHMQLIARFTPEKAASIVNEAAGMLSTAAIPHSHITDSAISVTTPAFSFSLRNSPDGYLRLSTASEFKSASTLTYSPKTFAGHKAIAMLSTPVLRDIFPGTGAPDMAVTAELSMTGNDAIDLSLSFARTREPFLSNLINLIRWYHIYDPLADHSNDARERDDDDDFIPLNLYEL